MESNDTPQPAPQTPEEWSDERRREYRLAVAARGDRQQRVGRGFAIVLFVLVAASVVLRVPAAWWVPAVGAAALLGLGFRLVNWKCPNCGERLPTRGPLARCHGCGAPLP